MKELVLSLIPWMSCARTFAHISTNKRTQMYACVMHSRTHEDTRMSQIGRCPMFRKSGPSGAQLTFYRGKQYPSAVCFTCPWSMVYPKLGHRTATLYCFSTRFALKEMDCERTVRDQILYHLVAICAHGLHNNALEQAKPQRHQE